MRKMVPFVLAAVAFAVWYGLVVHPYVEVFAQRLLAALVAN